MRGLGAFLATGIAGGLGGALFAVLGLPLPWLLGSLCAVSLLSLTVGAAPLSRSGLRIGQMTIGLALGLYFTAPVIAGLVRDGHWIVLSAVLTCVLSLLGAMVFQRLTHSDATTSLYAAAIGAASDMAQQAAASGARAEVVALVHSIRVFIVVGSVPFFASAWISFAGHPGTAQSVSGAADAFMPSVLGLTETVVLAALAVGASRVQVVFHHVLPLALPGILTGSILALSRAIGEAAPLLVLGIPVFIASTPDGPMSPFTVLPFQIFNWAGRPQPAFHQLAASAIIVLLLVLLSFNALAIYLRHRLQSRTS